MRDAIEVKRNFEALEKRRVREYKLLKQGLKEAEVSRKINSIGSGDR